MELVQAGEVNWPTFFVVGAHKAGTTSIYAHLKRHPEVFLPGVKEPRYFAPEVINSVNLDQYRSLYVGAAGYAATGDISPFYLPTEGTPARIRAVCPAARIVIMLRDPVERAYSHFLHYQRAGVEPLASLHDALRRYEDRPAENWSLSQEYVEHGLYHAQVRRYMETFGRDQVLALLFDELEDNPNELLARIAQHIGVDPDFFAKRDLSEVHNPYYVPKSEAIRWVQSLKITRRLPSSLKTAVRPFLFNMQKPPLDDDSRRRLQEWYDPDLARLEELLGRKIPELRKSWI
jgi:hypothetical protein